MPLRAISERIRAALERTKGATIQTPRTKRRLAKPEPQHGPGTEFESLVNEVGKDANVAFPNGCSCRAIKRRMNSLGVEGCRKPETREELLAKIRENFAKVDWSRVDVGKLRRNAIGTGFAGLLAFADSRGDECATLYDLALQRASVRIGDGAQNE